MLDLVGQDKTLQFLETTMDLLSYRHSLVASNIANVDTPGYRTVDMQFKRELHVAFERHMNEEMGAGAGAALRFSEVLRPEVVQVPGLRERVDGNNVDIDREMGQLGKVTGLYRQAVKFFNMKLGLIKAAMGEGG